MNRMIDVIKARKSVRTFDGRPVSQEDRNKLESFIAKLSNPYDIPVEFVFLDPKAHGLSSPVIRGETMYIAAKVRKAPHCEEAYGFSFEKLVLFARSIGIGTTWIGGTMDREAFEKAAETGPDELMMIVSPLGYPAESPCDVDKKLRKMVHGDERLPAEELFFDRDFSTPLSAEGPEDILEAVRWAPSAVNLQPWRIVRDGDKYHFYEKHTEGYTKNAAWDVQRIDLGIAICHMMSVAEGSGLSIADPGIPLPEDTEYIATVTV